jgi:hypothetical protein
LEAYCHDEKIVGELGPVIHSEAHVEEGEGEGEVERRLKIIKCVVCG